MEELNNKINEYEDDFIETMKIFIYSFIGIFIIFIPIRINGVMSTTLIHINNFIIEDMLYIVKVMSVVYTILGCTMIFIKKNNTKDKKNISSYIKLLSILIVINIFYSDSQSYFLLSEKTLFLTKELIYELTIMLPLFAIFLPLIKDYGLLEISESFLQKDMKKIFKLSGKTIINILVFLATNCFCGLYMLNKLYIEGKLREREACILYTNFSLISYSLIKIISQELNINTIELLIIMASFFIISNFILCRVYPLNKKKSSYYIKTEYKETIHKKNKLEKGIQKYIQNRKEKNIFKLIMRNVLETIKINIDLIPNILIVMFMIDKILLNESFNLINLFAQITTENISIYEIDEILRISILGFFDNVVAIESLEKNLLEVPKILIGVIMISKCITFTNHFIYLEQTLIPISKKEVVIIYIEKIFIIVTMFFMMYYFCIGYLSKI